MLATRHIAAAAAARARPSAEYLENVIPCSVVLLTPVVPEAGHSRRGHVDKGALNTLKQHSIKFRKLSTKRYNPILLLQRDLSLLNEFHNVHVQRRLLLRSDELDCQTP